MTELRPGARVIRAGHDTTDLLHAGTANVIRLRPGRRVEILLDRETGAKREDRIVFLREVDVIAVTPDLSRLPADKQNDPDAVANYRAWFDLPYPAVPWNTCPGRVHLVVAIHGTMWTGWPSSGTRVVGVTACGKGRDGNLELDRDDSSTFPPCKRCWGVDS